MAQPVVAVVVVVVIDAVLGPTVESREHNGTGKVNAKGGNNQLAAAATK